MKLALSSAALAILLLTGCSVQPRVTPEVVDWQGHSRLVSQLHQWQLQGKLGFKSANQGGSANLRWSQNQQQYQLSLTGPFGAGSATLIGNSTMAELRQDNQLYTGLPDQLAIQLTGVPIPVDALSWWARGLPSPHKSESYNLVTTANGTAASFTQAGWQLAFSRYSLTPEGTLPRKIIGQHGGHSFKLVISRWSFPDN